MTEVDDIVTTNQARYLRNLSIIFMKVAIILCYLIIIQQFVHSKIVWHTMSVSTDTVCICNFGMVNYYIFPYSVFTIHEPSLSLPSRFKTPIFCKVERSRSMVRWLTDKVSDIWGVGRGKDDGLELGRSRFEHRFQFVLIPIQGFGLIADACESATSLLHIVKLSHHVC